MLRNLVQRAALPLRLRTRRAPQTVRTPPLLGRAGNTKATTDAEKWTSMEMCRLSAVRVVFEDATAMWTVK